MLFSAKIYKHDQESGNQTYVIWEMNLKHARKHVRCCNAKEPKVLLLVWEGMARNATNIE